MCRASRNTTNSSLVILKALRLQPRPGANLDPAIEVLIARLIRQVEIPAAITLTEHFVELTLSLAQSAVYSLVQVIPFLPFRIAAIVYTHQPSAAVASDDLPSFSCR